MTKVASASLAILALVIVVCVPRANAGERIVVNYKKEATGGQSGLQYRYTFEVKTHKTKTPVEGAAFTVATDMPSMPGAHHMPHVTAEPGNVPGTYNATLDFDMAGGWNLILRFTKPRRDQIVVSDDVTKQPGRKGDSHEDHRHHHHSKHERH